MIPYFAVMKFYWLLFVILLSSCSPKVSFIILERIGEPKDDKQQFYCERVRGVGADIYWLDRRHQANDKVWLKEKK